MSEAFHKAYLQTAYTLTTAFLPIVLSLTVLWFTLKDRHAKLQLRERVRDWATLKFRSGQVIFAGAIEVYNSSSRANAIRAYRFWCKPSEMDWLQMERERYLDELSSNSKDALIYNHTPLPIPPYSGVAVSIQAIIRVARPYTLPVLVEIEDLFGKTYRLKIEAKA